MTTSLTVNQTIKTTTSLCPVCLRQIDARVDQRDGKVFLHKTCPEHGEFDVLINSDARFYYPSVGCGSGCGCAGSTAEHAATCIALVEIVESCNLACPTCYAASPPEAEVGVQALSLDDFRGRIDAVIARKGPIDILQLSGGEPTIHPQFFELLEGVLTDKRIGYTLLNTNGLLLARDDRFMAQLADMHKRLRRFELYLQFDGPQEAGQRELRSADLRALKLRVVQRCAEHGIPVTLAMTVDEHNLPHLGDTLRFGLAHAAVRGITFQPMFMSGRTLSPREGVARAGRGPGEGEASSVQLPVLIPGITERSALTPTLSQGERGQTHLNVADIILGLINQSAGLLTERDFTPLPCGDPNCHTIGYLLRRNDQVVRVSDFVDFSQLQGFLKDRIDFNIEDLHRCGCESEELGRVLKQLEIGPDHVFRLFIKPFMDAWTYDQHRIDRCCVHVVGAGGKLESFCRHYALKG